MAEFEIGKVVLGVPMAGLGAWVLRRVMRSAKPAGVPASVSIEQGVRLLEAGMAEIRAAVAGIPALQQRVAIQGADILVLQTRAHRTDADLSDIRRVAEEMESTQRDQDLRIRRLERREQ